MKKNFSVPINVNVLEIFDKSELQTNNNLLINLLRWTELLYMFEGKIIKNDVAYIFFTNVFTYLFYVKDIDIANQGNDL